MKFSECGKQKEKKIKNVKVRFIRKTFEGDKVYETLSGKKTYILWNTGKWTTCMGTKALDYNFIISE